MMIGLSQSKSREIQLNCFWLINRPKNPPKIQFNTTYNLLTSEKLLENVFAMENLIHQLTKEFVVS